MTTPEQLAAEWLAAKKTENAAATRRLEIEQELLKFLPPKEEGRSTTTLTNGFRVMSAGKLTYKADVEHLLSLTSAWPADAKPIRTKIEADESLLKAIRTDRPDLWRQISPAISVKPAKTYIVIEEPTHGI